jgi:hypothetical protein
MIDGWRVGGLKHCLNAWKASRAGLTAGMGAASAQWSGHDVRQGFSPSHGTPGLVGELSLYRLTHCPHE